MNKIIIGKVNGKYEIRRKDDEVQRLKMLTIDSGRENADRSTNGQFSRNIVNDDVNCCSSKDVHVADDQTSVNKDIAEDDVPEEWLHLLEASINLRRCPLCKDVVIRELYFQHLKKRHPNTNAMSDVENKLVQKARIVNPKRGGDNQKILFGMEKCKNISMSRLKNNKVTVIRNLVCTTKAVETNSGAPGMENTNVEISKKLHRECVVRNPKNVDPLPENTVLSVSINVNNFTEKRTLKLLSNIPKKPLLFEYSTSKNCNGLSNNGSQNLPRVIVVSDTMLSMFTPLEYRQLFAGISLSPPPTSFLSQPPSPFLSQPPIFPPLPTSPPPIDTSVYHSEQPPPPPTSPQSSPEPIYEIELQSKSKPSSPEPIFPVSPTSTDSLVNQNELKYMSRSSSPEPIFPESPPSTDSLVNQNELKYMSRSSSPESIFLVSTPSTDTLVNQIESQSTSRSSSLESIFPESPQSTDSLVNQIELKYMSRSSSPEPILPESPLPTDTMANQIESQSTSRSSSPESPPSTDTSVNQIELKSTSRSSSPERILSVSPPPNDILGYQIELESTSSPEPLLPVSPLPTDTVANQIESQSTPRSSSPEPIFPVSRSPTDNSVNQIELQCTSSPEPILPTSPSQTHDNQISLYRQPSLFENSNNVSEIRLVDEKQSDDIGDNKLPVCNNVGEQKCPLDPRLASFGNIERIYTRSDEFDDISGNEDENDDFEPQQFPQKQQFTPTYENISDDDEENHTDRTNGAFSDLSIAFSTNSRGENLLNVSYVKNNDKRLVRISFQYDQVDFDNFTRKEIISNVRNYILSNICSLDIVEISQPKIIENVIQPESEIKIGGDHVDQTSGLSMTGTFTNNTLAGNETDDSISSGSFETDDKLPESDRQSVNEREEPLFFNGFDSNIEPISTSGLLAAVTEMETYFVNAVENSSVQESSRVQDNVVDSVRDSVLDKPESSYVNDNHDIVLDVVSDDEKNDDQNTTNRKINTCVQEGSRVEENVLDSVRDLVLNDNHDSVINIVSDDEEHDDQNTTNQQCQKNLTQEATTSNNNTSSECGGITVPPQALEKVLEMLTSIYQQTSRLTSPTQSQCGVCHHCQDLSHVTKLQEICESMKIDPKLMMAPPNDAMSTKKTPELPITIVVDDDDDDDIITLDSKSNKIQKPSILNRNSTNQDECEIVETVHLQPRPGPSKRRRQVKADQNEPKPKIRKSNNIPYVHRGDNDVIVIEDSPKPSTSKSAKIDSLSQLKRKYNYVEAEVDEFETSLHIVDPIDKNCDTDRCTIPRKKLKRIQQLLDTSLPARLPTSLPVSLPVSLPTNISTSCSTKSSICYVSHHSATSASTATSTSAASSAESPYVHRARQSKLFKQFLNPNNDYCTVTYDCDGSIRSIIVNSSAKGTPKQYTYRQLRKVFRVAEIKREVYKSFTNGEYSDEYCIQDACERVDDYVYYSLRTYKTELEQLLKYCYGNIPKKLNPHMEKFLDDDLKYKHINNSAFNRKKNGIDKKKMSDKEREEYIYSFDCDDFNHYSVF